MSKYVLRSYGDEILAAVRSEFYCEQNSFFDSYFMSESLGTVLAL